MTRVLVLALALATAALAEEPYDVHLQLMYAGVPVPGADATLVIDGQTVARDTSDENGRIDFEGLTVERFEVLMKKPGYFDRRVIYYNFTRKDITGQVVLKKRIRWALTGSVRGKHALIAGARVDLTTGADQPQQTATAADGTFAFRELYDTECAFAVEAPGFHTQRIWSANRPQQDLHWDVELRPAALFAAGDWLRGEPDPALEIHRVGLAPISTDPEGSVRALVDLIARSRGPARLGPGEDGPAGAIALARIVCPRGLPPAGTLARADQLLARWVMKYRRGIRGR